jgi:IMP dehydrogenase
MKALSFDDISLVPRFNNIASRRDADTSVRFGNLYLRIPVFSANMDTITDVAMARRMRQLGGLGFLHRFCSIEDNIRLYKDATIVEIESIIQEAVVSLGVNEGLDRFHALYEVGARYFCIDIAHGHSRAVGQLIKQIKEFSDDTFVVAGNVCHEAGAEYLASVGADAIKIGIGPGSVCSTRIKTGFGVPQFSAIQACSKMNVFIIADGGIRTPGDAVKALYAGADAIMIGGMLSGTDETPGEVICEPPGYTLVAEAYGSRYVPPPNDAEQYKVFRGMASKEAQDDFMGQMNDWKTAEGVEIKVRAKGPVSNVISDLMGGIRSGMTYCGANNLEQIRTRASHVEVTPAGVAEGRPHGEGRL